MKIHATRVPAPTVTQEHGTKWQVAVTTDDDQLHVFDEVAIDGPSVVRVLPEEAPLTMQPRVWVEPLSPALVYGFESGCLTARFDRGCLTYERPV